MRGFITSLLILTLTTGCAHIEGRLRTPPKTARVPINQSKPKALMEAVRAER